MIVTPQATVKIKNDHTLDINDVFKEKLRAQTSPTLSLDSENQNYALLSILI